VIKKRKTKISSGRKLKTKGNIITREKKINGVKG